MISIRSIRESDLDAVAAIEEKLFSHPWKKSDFADMVNRQDRGYIVAELDGVVIGGAAYRNIVGDVEITNVELLEEYRGNGYSKLIMQRVIVAGREAGGEAFTLEVRSKNEVAIGLYKRMGFVIEGVRKSFYDLPKDDALIMWLR